VGVARRGTGLAAVRGRRRPLRGRPASRNRHRGCGGRRAPRSRSRRRLLHRAVAARGALHHDSHSGWLLDHARAPRLDRRAHGDGGRGERRRGHDRPERRGRVGRAVRPPRRSPDRGSERLRRPAVTSARSTGEPASAAPGRAAARLGGSSRGPAGPGGAACRSTPPIRWSVPPRHGRAFSRACTSGRRGLASAGSDVPWRAGRSCHARPKRSFLDPAGASVSGYSGARTGRRVGRRGSCLRCSSQLARAPASDCARADRSACGEPGTVRWIKSAPARANGRLRCRAARGRNRRPQGRAAPNPAPVGFVAPP
jgi:hypothetical protein